MKKILFLFVMLMATCMVWAENVITYTATSQLRERPLSMSNYSGLHIDAFNVPIIDHIFSNGIGTITFGGDVTNIENYAFYGCSSLTSITIPNSVTSIGNHAFEDCSNLRSVAINSNAICSKNYSFTTTLQSIFGLQVASYVIGDSVTSIGDNAFYMCSHLISVMIGNSVTSIGNNAFYMCSYLASVTIGNSVTSIGNSAFYDCSGLTSITLPESVTSIGGHAFKDCSRLTSITIPNSVTSISYRAFSGCFGLTSITVDPRNTVYDSRNDCNAIIETETNTLMAGCESTIIPNSVTSIGDHAFSYCYGLTSIAIPNSVTSIGSSAFEHCHRLTNVTIGNSVTSIGDHAFSYCYGLTSITIPESVTSIGSSAFKQCSSLTAITIPNSVTSIGDYAFSDCSGLTSVTMEAETPPSFGTNCFYGTSPLKIYVPCETLNAYQSASSAYANYFAYPVSVYQLHLNCNSSHGFVSIITQPTYCSEGEIVAISDFGYHFVRWSDGNTDNPRIILVTQDTLLTAEIALSYSGICGDNLTWQYDTKVLTISGMGDMYHFTSTTMPWLLLRDSISNVVIEHGVTSIGDYAFYGCNDRAFTKLVMPQSVKKIGNYAFADCNRLTSVVFSSDMDEVGDYAFSGCTRINDMTCYALVTPDAAEHTFEGVNHLAYLFVQTGSKRTYELDPYWGVFDIHEIGADSTVISNNQVQVVPTDNEAVFTWPMSDNANSYLLSITKDGEVFCTLTFNANGQLINIAFAPTRCEVANAPTATTSIAGMSFTVTGLDGASKYAYRLSAKDAANTEIVTYSGEFATAGYEGDVTPGGLPDALDEIFSIESVSKRIVNGQLLILRDGELYDAIGRRVE